MLVTACTPTALQEAADQALAAGQPAAAEQRSTSCRVLYRLAHYADGLYRNIEVRAGHKCAATVVYQSAHVAPSQPRTMAWISGSRWTLVLCAACTAVLSTCPSAPTACCPAHHVLSLRFLQAQKASTEYKTSKAVIEAKRRQVRS